ncbi:hypothetical protein [Paenibacillus campi]|uniref:hypothetical protein n=1 Tax=Paenibacillus campi TaxID=3106031 RepID=UPI002AFF1943|nr:hypothetical protein [Paenibacillus sp. SGZ-1009]
MKKNAATLILFVSIFLSSMSMVSAQSSTENTYNTNSATNPTVLNPVTPGSFNSPLTPAPTKNSGIGILATDGQNMSYSFNNLTNRIISNSPLPGHRYGTISLNIVQDTGLRQSPADITYRFMSTDGSLASSSVQVAGNINGKTITIRNVPKATSDKPIYLFIFNNRSDKLITSGNGYTL